MYYDAFLKGTGYPGLCRYKAVNANLPKGKCLERGGKDMTNIATASRDQLKGIFDIDSLEGTTFKVTVTPISEEEASEIEFKSLKGIAGRPLDLDQVRKERLKL